MKYPMKEKTEQPLFEFFVRDNMGFDYYLYDNFNDALHNAETLSINGNRCFLVYEIFFNTTTREYHLQNTFRIRDGKISYDKYAFPDLHVQHYLKSGEWMNPREDWLEILKGI